MNKQFKLLLLVLGFVILIVAAVRLYPGLAAQYEPGAAEQTAAAAASRLPAPDFSVENEDGELVSLSDFAGRPVVLNMWASWCGPCRQELPDFDAAYADYGEEVAFMMVNLTDGTRETVEGVRAFVEEKGYSFPVYYDLDSEAALAYGVRSIPTSVFIDAEGNIAGSKIGILSAKDLQAQIERILDNSVAN